MAEQRTVMVERLKIEGRTCRNFVAPGGRRGAWNWFEADEVPPFVEEAARFVIERKRPRGWRILHQGRNP